MSSWDHTAQIVSQVYNLTTVVANALGGGKRSKPKEANHFNPYRLAEVTSSGKINSSNFSVLRIIGNNIVRSK